MASADDFRAALKQQLTAADHRGDAHIDINAGALHGALDGQPGHAHKMPVCCSVMKIETKAGDRLLSSPALGNGATLTIRYRLPRKGVFRPLAAGDERPLPAIPPDPEEAASLAGRLRRIFPFFFPPQV